MKTVDEMTREELLALSDDEVIRMIDYACAVAGIKNVPEPTKPEIEHIPKDQTVYELGGFIFERKEDADRILELIQGMPLVEIDYDSKTGYRYKYIKGLTDMCPSIRPATHYSYNNFQKFRAKLKAQKDAQDTYDVAKKDHSEMQSLRDEVAEPILTAIGKARSSKYEEDKLVAEFGRYVDLAENNKVIAMNFLRRAYNVPDRLVETLCPGYFESDDATEKEAKDTVDSEDEQ